MIELPMISARPEMIKRARTRHRYAFTLVELLVVISIIGILIGMLLPGVQAVREASRRTSCQSKLHNIGLAILNFESSHRAFPPGATFETQHSWGSVILPYLDQRPVFDTIEFEENWSAEVVNSEVAAMDLGIFSCPSSQKLFPGKTDYCGISGSWRNAVGMQQSTLNGMLFPVVRPDQQEIRIASVTDGTSHTLMVSEGVEVLEENNGFWACGLNCFTHEDGGINAVHRPADEIVSDHPSGAVGCSCDGSVRFFGNQIDDEIIAALCTRNGGESSDAF